MIKRIKICLAVAGLLLAACYNNSLEELANQDECGTSNISYSKDIRPLINIYCNIGGCHNSGSATTFSLTSYAALKEQAELGILLRSINHQGGAEPMPKNSSKLSACTISKITAWVNAGTPDN